MKYKKTICLVGLYLFVVGLSCFFTEKTDITMENLYYHFYYFIAILLICYHILSKSGDISNDLYRYKSISSYKKTIYIYYTISNIVLTIGVFVSNLLCVLVFGAIDIHIKGIPLYIYPIHFFIIFQIVSVFILANVTSKNYNRKIIPVLIVIFVFFLIGKSSEIGNIFTLNLLYPFFTGTLYIDTLILYLSWLGIGLIYNFQKDKAVEI